MTRLIRSVLTSLAVIAAGIVVFSACAMQMQYPYAPYQVDKEPPFWYCATATPRPTATPQPEPGDWCSCHGPNYPEDCGTPAPGWTCPGWEPPDWPPTPYPPPTPFFISGGEFFQHQNIFLPINPATNSEPDAKDHLRIRFEEKTDFGGDPAEECSLLGFEAQLHSTWESALISGIEENGKIGPKVDFDFYTQTFLWFENDPTNRYFSTAKAQGRFASNPSTYAYAPTTFYPFTHAEISYDGGISYTPVITPAVYKVAVPICYPPQLLGSNWRIGIVAAPHDARVGTAGAGQNLVGGADSVFYIKRGLIPMPASACFPINEWTGKGCDCRPAPDIRDYPENDNVPAQRPDSVPFTAGPGAVGGGKLAEGMPVSGGICSFVRGFGCEPYNTGVWGAGRCPASRPWYHTGIDIGCETGHPIYNILQGAIVRREFSPVGYGNVVTVQGRAYESWYAHMSAFGGDNSKCKMQVGSLCALWSEVGKVGSTGNSTGPHLHWEIRFNGSPVDPLQYAGSGKTQDTGTEPNPLELASSRLMPASYPVAAATPTATRIPRTPLKGVATAAPRQYPMTVVLRDAEGAALSGPTVTFYTESDQQVGQCAFAGAPCSLSLPPGVYKLKMGGRLSTGATVAQYSDASVEAEKSKKLEVLNGPMSVMHDSPSSKFGLVLVTENGTGALQPYFDLTPDGTPSPVDPRKEPETVPQVATRAPVALPGQPAPQNGAAADPAAPFYRLLLCLGMVFVLCLGVMIGLWLRNLRNRRRSQPVRRPQQK